MFMMSRSKRLSLFVFAMWKIHMAESLSVPRVALASISSQQLAGIDGPEWASIRTICSDPTNEKSSTRLSYKMGIMKVVCGTLLDTDERVIGIACDEEDSTAGSLASTYIYQDSVARIPKSMPDALATTTLIASLGGIHCVYHNNENDDNKTAQKVVIMGGSDYSCFCAKGLAALGCPQVYLVSQNKPSVTSSSTIQVLDPAMGELGVGFSDFIGSFDTLLDTLSDEAKLSEQQPMAAIATEDEYIMDQISGGVLKLLESRHGCHR
jgi:hypothetical protein